MFIGKGDCYAVSFFCVINLAIVSSVQFWCFFFDIIKVSQVYFTITYETFSAERQGFEPWDQTSWSTVFETAPIDHSGISPSKGYWLLHVGY